jgi:hypothetical protein
VTALVVRQKKQTTNQWFMKASKIGLVIALVAGVLLAGGSAVRAQDGEKKKDAPKRERPGGPGGSGGDRAAMMKERLDKMSEELKLNEEQKKKTETALKDQMEKMRGLREDSSLSNEQKREKAMAAREAMDKEMKKILTADQYAKYEKMPGPGRGGPGGEARKGERGERKREGQKKE